MEAELSGSFPLTQSRALKQIADAGRFRRI
jgi:hypothetical protein